MTVSQEAAAQPGIPLQGTLHLQVLGGPIQSIPVNLAGTDGYIIGRSDSRSTFIPDIDLSEQKALEKGVSRRHAVFLRRQDRLVLLDLGSVNGTFLNGQRLKPDEPYALNIGDKLGFGDLTVLLAEMEQ
jgi:pSer/pThr/pTyr-binding forkhead associated (FHA) protein